MKNIKYILAILLPTVIVAIDNRLALVSVGFVIAGLLVVSFTGLKCQLTKHKDSFFAHLTSPGELLNLKLTASEKNFLLLGLAITAGGLLSLLYLTLSPSG